MYSSFVRNLGDNLDLLLASEVKGSLVGIGPLPVGSALVSESNYTESQDTQLV